MTVPVPGSLSGFSIDVDTYRDGRGKEQQMTVSHLSNPY